MIIKAKFFLIILILTFFNYSFSQIRFLKRAIKKIEKQEFNEAFEDIEKYQQKKQKNLTSPIAYFCKYRWFIDDKNPNYNPKLAFKNLDESIKFKNFIDQEDSSDYCIDFQFCNTKLSYLRESTAFAIFNVIKSSYRLDSINAFIIEFNSLEASKKATKYRDSVEYQIVIAINSISEFENYMREYPKSVYYEAAQNKIYEIAFDNAKTLNTEKDFQYFLENYPKAPQKEQAKKLAEISAKNEALKSNTLEQLKGFLQRYPKSEFLQEVTSKIHELEFETVTKLNTEKDYLAFVAKYPDAIQVEQAKKLAIKASYEYAINSKSISELKSFLNKYPNSEFEYNIKNTIHLLAYEDVITRNEVLAYEEYLINYKSSIYAKQVQLKLEELYYNKLLEEFTNEKCNKFIEKFPNNIHVNELKDRMNNGIINANTLKIDNSRFFNGQELKYTLSVYLSDPIFNHYFKNDTALLMDQLKRIGEVRFENGKYYSNYIDFSNYYYDNEYDQESDNNEKKHFTSYGISFYDKNSSRYGCECPPGFFDNDGSFGYSGKPNCIILDEKNKSLFNFIIREIKRTPISYVFIIENENGKKALFNSKYLKLITDWVDEIEYPMLESYYFHPKSLTSLLLRVHNNFHVGFKTIKQDIHKITEIIKFPNNKIIKETRDSISTKYQIINSNGEEIINSSKFQNPFKEVSSISQANLKILETSTCNSSNGNFGSGFMRFENNNLEGIASSTFDTILLPAKYDYISSLDLKGNLILKEKFNNGKNNFSIFNLYRKTYFINENAFKNVDKLHFPIENGKKLIETYNNSLLYEYSYFNSVDFCYNEFDEENKNEFKTNNVIYLAENQNGHHLFNNDGKLLLSDKDKIEITEAIENNMIVNLKNKTIIMDYFGKIIWELPKPYKIEFLSKTAFLYAKVEKSGDKAIGVYDLIKGKITEAEFENILIEENLIYGIKLGKKIKIFN
jgi:outer membrane protein assembly factor BamD (BamD/ComL family)